MSIKKLLVECLALTVLAATIACVSSPEAVNDTVQATPAPVSVYTFRVINAYPHDRDAFTQGLAFENGELYEGTGFYGKSSLRIVDLETGEVRQIHTLPREHFGEGITVYEDEIVQLTWRSHKGFVYDRQSFRQLGEFSYETEGWGITHDQKRLIMSDGTATLYFLDPDTYTITGQIEVHDSAGPVENLNELEYVDGLIYANVWLTDRIVMIDPDAGRVTGWIDLAGILPPQNAGITVDVLNGIAYDAKEKRLFVTGKYWPELFEIELVKQPD